MDGGGRATTTMSMCLGILRYTVATVVTVLAVVVIVRVIYVGVRPNDVSVSVVRGYVRTSDLWMQNTTTYVYAKRIDGSQLPRRRSCIGGRGAQNSQLVSSCFGVAATADDDDMGSDNDVTYGGHQATLTSYMYSPVASLNLAVVLRVDNQSGRGSIHCTSINITFSFDGNTSTAAGMEIAMLNLTSSFDVKPQTSHQMILRASTGNRSVLTYIANTYGGESSFTGVVEVTMNTSSNVFGIHRGPRIVTLVCSQVYFSVGYHATFTSTSIQCIESN